MKPIVKGSVITGSLAALAAVSITGNVLMYYRYSSSRPIVTVGSQIISKKDYQDALDYQTQGAVLKKMVLADLINQAAAKAGVTPSDADVTERIKQLTRTSPVMVANALEDPTRAKAFRQDVATQIALENLQIKDTQVTEAQIEDFYNRHKQSLRLPPQVSATMVLADNSVDASSAASLLRQNIALDVIARQPRLHVVGMNGFNINGGMIPAAINKSLSSAAFHMKTGDVQVVPAGKYYFVLRANQQSSGAVPSLSQVRPEVERLARLEKAPPQSVEIARLYQQAPPQFAVVRYAAYFSDISAPATVASSSNQTAQTE